MEKKKRGRPRSINCQRVQFSLDQETITSLNKISQAQDRPKSVIIRRLVASEKKRIDA